MRRLGLQKRFEGTGWWTNPEISRPAVLGVMLGSWLDVDPITRGRKENNMFYIIGVIVVVLFIAGFLGLR